MQAGEVKRLKDAPDFTLNIAVGDSLIHGRGGPDLDQGRWEFDENGELAEPEPVFTYATEDVSDFAKTVDLLGVGSYHVLVGNPPYIKVKDETENSNYRYYKSCMGTYALSIPFTERFFQLAIRAQENRQGAGYVGQITANSFIKREFGKRLIEEFLPTIRLTYVIDSSGVHIPDHPTPTVILIGRRTFPHNEPIRAILSIQAEPTIPTDSARGYVWQSIIENIHKPDTITNWINVTDIPREHLSSHPWTLAGGGVGKIISIIEANLTCRLRDVISPPVGRSIRVGADEAFMRPSKYKERKNLDSQTLKTLAIGETIRDWSANHVGNILYPYASNVSAKEIERELWPWRELLAQRRTFQSNMADANLQWYDYMQHTASAYKTPLSIGFAFMATHNHLALDRGGSAFNRSAPVIKLPRGASEDDHLEIMATLNSSTACFWLKQVSQPRGQRDRARSPRRAMGRPL
ncbi:BREX-2 system adenine-specific DNA-methyltransferase PglX [Actinomadura chokoriensis]|uniref:site-specific DNA-methyltransferase (adenine-specific) n=1 Tax=Actinomadura chokoriensis TaxID=454156 RepID=A0ABV4QQ76_9ACTN